MKRVIYLILFTVTIIFSGCKHTYKVPHISVMSDEKVKIFPDYTDIVIPSNIAPLNFMIKKVGEEFIVQIKDGDTEKLVTGCDKTGIIQFDFKKWEKLLKEEKGRSLQVWIYVNNNNEWTVYKQFNWQIAKEPIDKYLSYRLIEPGYELYRQMGLYQRNMTNFDVQVIYENNRIYSEENSHCVNCHNYQNYSTKRMLFHVRANHGGTIIAENGKIEKINTKADSILGSAVYPSWHPKRNWLVFSSNKTGQVFHIMNKNKIEVLDYSSDLIFYNADTKQISNILKTSSDFETFPCWTPKGDRIFYCVAHTECGPNMPDSDKISNTIINYQKLKYSLMSMSFDEKTQTFGKPKMEFNCAAIGKSASVPRVSPDGRYVLFTLGNYGQFHIWHRSSDLYVKDLLTGKIYPMKAANSTNVDSYHSWSSNGRWFVFSSRRDDGNFTRPYIAYFDNNGIAHKAFMLPQEDPTFTIRLFKSFNVPEMTKDAVPFTASQFKKVIYGTKVTPVTYKEIRLNYKK